MREMIIYPDTIMTRELLTMLPADHMEALKNLWLELCAQANAHAIKPLEN